MERLLKRRKRRASIDFLLGLINFYLLVTILGILVVFFTFKESQLISTSDSNFSDLELSNYILPIEKNLSSFYISTYNSVSTNKLVQNTDDKFSYSSSEVNLKIEQLPKRVSFSKLSSNISKALLLDKELHGVYVYDLTRGEEAGVNIDKVMPPASISKVPLAINILKRIDEKKLSLDDALKVERSEYTYPSNVLNYSDIGNEYSIRELLSWLIVDSDNISLLVLEKALGGTEVNNQMTRDNLGVDPFFRDPHDATAKNVGKVFQGIYTQEYLTKESNEFLLNLLKNTASYLQQEIPPGLPDGTIIAHKTGRVDTNFGLTLEDAGIVYGENTDYVIVFLNYDIQTESARKKINEISELVYNTLN